MRVMRNVRAIISSLLFVMSVVTPVFAAEETLFLKAAKIYTAPDAEPLEIRVIQIRNGRIAAVGASEEFPEDELASECNGGVVLAGFQNSHVHLIGDGFFDARSKRAAALSSGIERMLTRFGYTTVVDTSSDLENTQVIRRRIESGEIFGPRILTVGGGVFPADGLPIYISRLPRQFLDAQLMPESAAAAQRLVSENIERGADATKLFVATPQSDQSLKRMPIEIARAAAEATHSRNKLVMVHPTDIEGVRLALAARADVLVHTTLGAESPWPQDVLQQLLTEEVAIAPTFKLLRYELQKQDVPEQIADRLLASTIEHFKPFVAAGGAVIFGTDVGYMTDHDPTDEYVLMQQAGMTPMQILASLTTEPARLWKEATQRGRVEVGMKADLVVLAADPSEDVRSFADVRCSIRGGKVIYRRKR